MLGKEGGSNMAQASNTIQNENFGPSSPNKRAIGTHLSSNLLDQQLYQFRGTNDKSNTSIIKSGSFILNEHQLSSPKAEFGQGQLHNNFNLAANKVSQKAKGGSNEDNSEIELTANMQRT